MKRKGFTIIEMLMVIGILSILIGIITTAASQSMQAARARRAEAAKKVVQTALAAYYAANDDWPVSGLAKRKGNHTDTNDRTDTNIYDLTADEVRTCVKTLVLATKNGNPYLDVSGLWVSKYDGNNPDRKDQGMDFWSAIRGTRESSKKMKLEKMYFGYPRSSDGGFERFGMGYSISGDLLTVGSRKEHLGVLNR